MAIYPGDSVIHPLNFIISWVSMNMCIINPNINPEVVLFFDLPL